MNNNNNNNMNYMDNNYDMEDMMYPEIYRHCMPVVDQIIRDMEKQHGAIYLTDDLLRQMTDEAIRRSGIDTSETKDGDAVPTINEYGPGHGYGRGGYRRRYDRSALSDILNILFLQQIFGRRRPNWRRR